MIRALDANPGVRPMIDRAFPLERLAEAFRYEEGATHFGKICVEI
jgi:NADPH:quinone reductase-like Zn-dependent oxidoreductase